VEELPATISKITSPAPTSASVIISRKPATAARRTGCRRANDRNAQTSWTATSRKATPEVSRWVNSTTVLPVGLRGMISPLQVGQWLPQPAPEPEARTYAPHRITPKVATRTSRENR
jgi:hypothetical protein